MENIENSKAMKIVNSLCEAIESIMSKAIVMLGIIVIIEQIVIALINVFK